MANFQLRDIDDKTWQRIATRAQLEGWPLRELIVTLLEDYQAGRVGPSKNAPMSAAAMRKDYVVILKFTCPKCNKSMEVDCAYRQHPPQLNFYAVDCPHCHQITERALPGDIVDVFKSGEREPNVPVNLPPK